MDDERAPLLLPVLLPWDPSRRKWAAVLLLTSLTLERLAFYALVTNLYVFLSLGGISSQDCLTAVLVLVGVAHFSALGGGWLADGLLGKFFTLFIYFIALCNVFAISFILYCICLQGGIGPW